MMVQPHSSFSSRQQHAAVPRRVVVRIATATIFLCSLETVSSFTTTIPHSQTQQQQQQQQHGILLPQRWSSNNHHNNVWLLKAQQQSDNDDSNKQQSSSSVGVSEQDRIQAEAESALLNVGWSMPGSGGDSASNSRADDETGGLTADDPFVKQIDAGIQADFGVALDDLLNPAKVVNLERDLFSLRQQLAQVTGMATSTTELQLVSTADCDGGGGGEVAEDLRKRILKKETDLTIERRSVFRGWLKNVFLIQAVISFGLSYVMATNPNALFGGFDWYYYNNMDLSISVLGYWWWWLFVVPSLRSRRPKGLEKQALDWAFLASPAVSLVAPVVTKDTGLIWWANCLVVGGCYAYSYLIVGEEENDVDDDNDDDDKNTPEWLKFLYKSLDFGSGRERGARK